MEIKTRKPEWTLNQEIQNETKTMSFKRLLIFPFQYLAE